MSPRYCILDSIHSFLVLCITNPCTNTLQSFSCKYIYAGVLFIELFIRHVTLYAASSLIVDRGVRNRYSIQFVCHSPRSLKWKDIGICFARFFDHYTDVLCPDWSQQEKASRNFVMLARVRFYFVTFFQSLFCRFILWILRLYFLIFSENYRTCFIVMRTAETRWHFSMKSRKMGNWKMGYAIKISSILFLSIPNLLFHCLV